MEIIKTWKFKNWNTWEYVNFFEFFSQREKDALIASKQDFGNNYITTYFFLLNLILDFILIRETSEISDYVEKSA